MEWYYVWWPWLTSKGVARVCQHQLSFFFFILAVAKWWADRTNFEYWYRKTIVSNDIRLPLLVDKFRLILCMQKSRRATLATQVHYGRQIVQVYLTNTMKVLYFAALNFRESYEIILVLFIITLAEWWAGRTSFQYWCRKAIVTVCRQL